MKNEPAASAGRRGHGALILVVLVAIAIMLVLMFGSFGGGSSYTKAVGGARTQAKARVQDINTQQQSILLAQWRQSNGGKLPKGPADLEEDAVHFKDPWGGELTFTFEASRGGAGGATKVHYKSKGPDGAAGTEDDVTKTDTLPF
ncbi:MAG: hypothetical protein WD749_01990 [Phycisphaerales bacterium]